MNVCFHRQFLEWDQVYTESALRYMEPRNKAYEYAICTYHSRLCFSIQIHAWDILWTVLLCRYKLNICHIPPCISSSQWIWSCWSTADNTWSWGCGWHNGRDWRWIQWWLTQQVTTTCRTLSAIRRQNIYTCLQLLIPWQKSRNVRNITTFLGLATTLSEKELRFNELWARHDPEGKNLSVIQHAQHTLTTSWK